MAVIPNKHERQQIRKVRDRSISRAVLATEREMFLARVLMHIVERLGGSEEVTGEGFTLNAYNTLKALAEGQVRDGPQVPDET